MSDGDYAYPEILDIARGLVNLEPPDLRESAFYTAMVRQRESLLQEFRDSKALSSKPMQAWLNPSGIKPLAFKVVVLPDAVEEVTKGGIIVPTEKVTKDEYATTAGTLMAVSGSAFSHVTEEEWGEDKPKVGDHVIFTKYGGFRRKGADGKDYLILKGEDIHAKIED